jgi:hypothetical protein
MSDVIMLSNVRLSFPHLVEPHASPLNPNAVKKYSADFIMPQDHPGFAQFMAQYAALAQAKWGTNAQSVMQMIQADRKLRCYGSGNEKVDKKTFQPYSGYANNVYISANKDQAPQMIQADGKPTDLGNTMAYQALARKMYGGCYVNAAIKPWVQENSFGRGIRCDLVAIQFFQDGEAFGEGAADASTLFGAVAGAAPAAPAFPAFLMPQ